MMGAFFVKGPLLPVGGGLPCVSVIATTCPQKSAAKLSRDAWIPETSASLLTRIRVASLK